MRAVRAWPVLLLAVAASLSAQPLPNPPGGAPLGGNPASLILWNKERPYAVGASEEAQRIVAAFAPAYAKLGRPRLLVRIRDEAAARPAGAAAADSPGEAGRAIARRFHRLLRHAGVILAEPPAGGTAGPEAAAGAADVVVEVRVSSRKIEASGPAGNRVVVVPEIAATAIRPAGSAVLGQATSREVLGTDRDVAERPDPVDPGDLAEAVALKLIDDIARLAR